MPSRPQAVPGCACCVSIYIRSSLFHFSVFPLAFPMPRVVTLNKAGHVGTDWALNCVTKSVSLRSQIHLGCRTPA